MGSVGGSFEMLFNSTHLTIAYVLPKTPFNKIIKNYDRCGVGCRRNNTLQAMLVYEIDPPCVIPYNITVRRVLLLT